MQGRQQSVGLAVRALFALVGSDAPGLPRGQQPDTEPNDQPAHRGLQRGDVGDQGRAGDPGADQGGDGQQGGVHHGHDADPDARNRGRHGQIGHEHPDVGGRASEKHRGEESLGHRHQDRGASIGPAVHDRGQSGEDRQGQEQ